MSFHLPDVAQQPFLCAQHSAQYWEGAKEVTCQGYLPSSSNIGVDRLGRLCPAGGHWQGWSCPLHGALCSSLGLRFLPEGTFYLDTLTPCRVSEEGANPK